MTVIEEHDAGSFLSLRLARGVVAPPVGDPSLVVAIGSAEGGREALEALFIALDEGADMSFVVIQHGERSGSPLTAPELQQFTELRVKELGVSDRLEPNHVFLAPTGFAVELKRGRFVLTRLAEPGARRTMVDLLFRSVAEAVGPRAVGIVLSGAGYDGALGTQSIARAGGMTLAHDPARARVGAMPSSAIARGAVDHVLSPFEMAEPLLVRSGRGTAQPTAAVSRGELARSLSSLQVVNRELQRVNRELLVTHGKLHRSVQELQQALDTVQADHEALMRAHTNLSSLLSHAPVAVIVLDEALNVRSFTRDAEHVYALTDSDIGLPLAAIAHRAHEMPPLPALSELHALARPLEEDVVTEDGWYLRRALPHHTASGEVDGMVLTFMDVTRLKSSEANARPHEARLRSIIDAMPSIISYVDEAVQRG